MDDKAFGPRDGQPHARNALADESRTGKVGALAEARRDRAATGTNANLARIELLTPPRCHVASPERLLSDCKKISVAIKPFLA